MTALLQQQLAELPDAPGVYMMKDSRSEVIYVGKAKSLKPRVRSYFQESNSDTREFIRHLVPKVERIDHVVTSNEKEALILENNLIKQFKPRFNIYLKDDKQYVSIKINMSHPFPRPLVVRKRKEDRQEKDVLLFGPYSSASKVRSTLRYLNRIFPLRECSDYVLTHRSRPCPLYEMRRCDAPCVDKVTTENYKAMVDEVVMVLKGKNEELVALLTEKMIAASQALVFEDAARYRDQIQSIQHIAERQSIESSDFVDRDVFAFHAQGEFIEIQAMFIRRGRLEDLTSYSFRPQDRSPEEVFGSFINLFYSEARMIPAEILLPVESEDVEPLAEYLSEQKGRKVQILVPQRGHKRRLVELADVNAANSFKLRHGSPEMNRQILNSLQIDIGLGAIPEHIECFDISNIGGELAVGSMVTFKSCAPDKKNYRHYKIKTVHQSDDFAMMYEVLTRRYIKALEENDLPNLTIIDGGKGQLSVAVRVFEELGITGVDLIGLAKSRRRQRGEKTIITDERVFKPNRPEPIVLPRDSAHLRYLARIRDEAHRFAITYHRKLREAVYKKRGLTAIPGVGDVIRKRLIKQFGHVASVRLASVEELAAVQGVSPVLAEKIFEHFHPDG
ncbi:MAG: excinuclease ABC subunit UvrC [Planctomycetota bacterium]|nr:excinuclease ABC subunit UvrC [Planctomycetota bacterium]